MRSARATCAYAVLLCTIFIIGNPTHVNGMPTVSTSASTSTIETATTRSRSLLRGAATTNNELELELDLELELEQTPADTASSWFVLSSVEGVFRQLLNGCGNTLDLASEEEVEDDEEEEVEQEDEAAQRKDRKCAQKPNKPVTCTNESRSETFRHRCAVKRKSGFQRSQCIRVSAPAPDNEQLILT